MPTYQLLPTAESPTPPSPRLVPPSPNPSTSIDALVVAARATLDQFYAEMMDFKDRDSREVLTYLAAFSAYASELRGRLVREPTRQMDGLRTKEIDPFLSEVDRQFKIYSRLITLNQQEWEMSRGGT